jgi:hypothetical protein
MIKIRDNAMLMKANQLNTTIIAVMHCDEVIEFATARG